MKKIGLMMTLSAVSVVTLLGTSYAQTSTGGSTGNATGSGTKDCNPPLHFNPVTNKCEGSSNGSTTSGGSTSGGSKGGSTSGGRIANPGPVLNGGGNSAKKH